MIDVAEGVARAMAQVSTSFQGTIDQGSYFITNLLGAAAVEEGMMVVHAGLPENTKVVSHGVTYIEIDRAAVSDASPALLWAGFGLDIALRDIEVHENLTLDRWAYLEADECLSQQFPMIEVLTASTETEYLEDHAPSLVGYDEDVVDIYVSHTGANVEEVRRWIFACMRAIKKVLYIDNTLGEQFIRVRRLRADYSEMFRIKDEGEYLKLGVQTLQVFSDALR